MKRAFCGAVLAGFLALASCLGPEMFAGGNSMFLKLGPAAVGFGNQQGWLALNSLNWAGTPYAQQGYPVMSYPQQAYPQTYPQQTYPTETYPQQTYPQQTYPTETYPQQAYPTESYPQETYPAETFPQQSYDANAQTAAVPSGPGLASLTTTDPAATAAIAQACASGQPLGTVTVRQMQPDGSCRDIQLNGVNLSCGGPSAGGAPGEALQPGEEVLMTFDKAEVVASGKVESK